MSRSWRCCLIIAALAAACEGSTPSAEDPDAQVMARPADAGADGPLADAATAPDAGDGGSGNGNAGGIAEIVFHGDEDNRTLVKEVAPRRGGFDGFSVLRAFVTRNSTELVTGYVQSLVEVRNEGQRTRCFITGTVVLRSGDDIVLDNDGGFVRGSVRAGEASPSCLGPGERGWFLGIHQTAFERVTSIEVVFDAGLEETEVPAARLAVERAAADVGQAVSYIHMVFRNQSAARATADGLTGGDWLLFDREAPVAWGFLSSCNDAVTIPLGPGDAAEVCNGTLFRGSGTSIQGWLGFEDAGPVTRGLAPQATRYRAYRAALQAEHARRRGSR